MALLALRVCRVFATGNGPSIVNYLVAGFGKGEQGRAAKSKLGNAACRWLGVAKQEPAVLPIGGDNEMQARGLGVRWSCLLLQTAPITGRGGNRNSQEM